MPIFRKLFEYEIARTGVKTFFKGKKLMPGDGPKMIFSLCNFGVKLHNLVFCKYAFLTNTRMHN